MILAGDIGGTKIKLAVFKIEGEILYVESQHEFSSNTFSSFTEVIRTFEKQVSLPKIYAACFGIAGPVIDGHCRTTNLPWDIDKVELQQYLGVDKVHLMNDLEAMSYGMLYMPDDEFVNLNPSARSFSGNYAVIAAGTGLGEAMLYHDGTHYHAIASEGGHSDFAPVTEQQDKLLNWMRHRYPEHVSYERILSGPGIYTLYEFLSEIGFAPEPVSMMNLEDGKDRSAMVSECAFNEDDPLCLEALRMFAEIYGAEAGNLALKSMSLGGVFIGGGIAPKILPILRQNYFMNAFTRKGRFEKMLRGMQVRISLNPETALLGAAYFALHRL